MNSDTAPAPDPTPPIKPRPPFDWSALPLLIGNPDQGWASSTSLLLPFSYRLHRRDRALRRPSHSPACQRPPESWHWQPADAVEATLGNPASDNTTADPANSSPGWVERRERYKYFTSDTAYVLFGRSKRFTLAGEFESARSYALPYPTGIMPQPGEVPACLAGCHAGRIISLHLGRPELWLFEYPSPSSEPSAHPNPDLISVEPQLRVA